MWDEDEGRVVNVDASTPRSVERMLAVDARIEKLVGLIAATPKDLAYAVRAMGGRIGRWRNKPLSPFVSALYRRGAPVWRDGWSADDEPGLMEALAEADNKVPLSLRDSYRNDIIATVVLAQEADGGFKAAGAAEGVIELVIVNASGDLLSHEILLGDTEAANALLPPHLALPTQPA